MWFFFGVSVYCTVFLGFRQELEVMLAQCCGVGGRGYICILVMYEGLGSRCGKRCI